MFVRTLFGPYLKRGLPFVKRLIQVRREARKKGWLSDLILCCGEENFEFASKHLGKAVLYDPDPMPVVHPWILRTKLAIHAFNYFDEIVSLDWDTTVRKGARKIIPKWQAEPSFQSPLQVYKQTKCTWREQRKDHHIVCGGFFYYCRDVAFLEKALSIQEKADPLDEVAFSWLVDELLDGFTVDKYLEGGFQPASVRSRRSPKEAGISGRFHFIHH